MDFRFILFVGKLLFCVLILMISFNFVGEMIVGLIWVMFMDEILIGFDSLIIF